MLSAKEGAEKNTKGQAVSYSIIEGLLGIVKNNTQVTMEEAESVREGSIFIQATINYTITKSCVN